MNAGLLLYAAVAATSVDTGWQPAPEGGLEYIIQIEPQLLELMRDGQTIQSEIPVELDGVRRYRVQIGTGALPRVGLPTTAARAIAPAEIETTVPLVEPAPSAGSPLPSTRPLQPPAPLRSLVPPAEEACEDEKSKAAAAGDAIVPESPSSGPLESDAPPPRKVISSEPKVIRSEPSPAAPPEATVERAASDEPSNLTPLPGRVRPRVAGPAVETSPADRASSETAVEPRPSLPAAARPPAVVEEPAVVERAPLDSTSSAPRGTTSRVPAAGPAPAPATSVPPRPSLPILGTTPRFIYQPPPRAATTAPESAAPAATNEGPQLGLDESVPLPQEPIKVVDPLDDGAARNEATSDPRSRATSPARVEPTSAASPATTPDRESTWGPTRDAIAPRTNPATVPPTGPATIPPTAPAATNESTAEPTGDSTSEGAAASGAWNWLGNSRDPAKRFSSAPAAEASDSPSAAAQATPEAIEHSVGRVEPQPLVEPTPTLDATGETSAAGSWLGAAGVRIGSWTIPTGVLVAAFVASLGGNLFLGWVAWGMQHKFARLAEQYQISQWKSPPTP